MIEHVEQIAGASFEAMESEIARLRRELVCIKAERDYLRAVTEEEPLHVLDELYDAWNAIRDTIPGAQP